MAVIEMHQLKKVYGKTMGISDVTFSVEKGELFGFIGPNGAGKSTTIRILLNMLYPTGGSAKILGLDVAQQSKAIKRETSYVPSDVRLYPDLSVRELLRINAAFYPCDSHQRAADLCELFEMDTTKKFRTLSTGNKKKAALILALMNNPKVLILDEPANGLDPMMQSRLFTELKQQTRQGMTVLLSSHNLAEVQAYCDRVAFIKKGRIVQLAELTRLTAPYKVVTVWDDRPNLLSGDGFVPVGQQVDRQTYQYRGTPVELLGRLAQANPRDFTVENESLEERFMDLYQEEDGHEQL